MNESLYVYLNLDTEKEQESEELIRRMDQLLLTAGMKYSGISNMYIPVDIQKRDRAVFSRRGAIEKHGLAEGNSGIQCCGDADQCLSDRRNSNRQYAGSYAGKAKVL